MATITRRGDLQWQAKVRRKGYPVQSRTFTHRADAEKWARAVERELETSGFVDRRAAEKNTFREILERYQREVTPSKKGAEVETARIDVLLRDPVLPNLKMSAVSSFEIAAWRDRRLKDVSGSTVNREMNVLSSLVNHARREWRIHMENPIPLVKRPENAKARERRISDEELRYLLSALENLGRNADGTFTKSARNPWLAPALRLALETAMRRSELLSLHWKNVDLKQRTAHLVDTKNGDARTVPLSSAAVATLRELPRSISGIVFPISPMSLRKGFERAVVRAREQYEADCATKKKKPESGLLRNLRFHDTRHEAASRLAGKLSNVLELSAVTGHKDLRMLKRYYHPRAEDLAKKLG